MKLLKLISCILCCIVTVYAPQEAHGNQTHQFGGHSNQQSKLQLKTNIIEQKSCRGDSLRLLLRLNYSNIGSQPIIFYKRSSVIGRYMISVNDKSAAARKYETEVSIMLDLMKAGLHFDSPEMSLFVVLKPGESHSIEAELYLPLVFHKANKNNLLPKGDRVLQVRVVTWYYSEAADKYRELWLDKGYLWSKDITSLPLPFKVETGSEITDCL
jgi:hypothetical protein